MRFEQNQRSAIEFKRLGDWLHVPNSDVNDNGNAFLDNNHADNDNSARLAVRSMKKVFIVGFYASHRFAGGLRSIWLAVSAHWFH